MFYSLHFSVPFVIDLLIDWHTHTHLNSLTRSLFECIFGIDVLVVISFIQPLHKLLFSHFWHMCGIWMPFQDQFCKFVPVVRFFSLWLFDTISVSFPYQIANLFSSPYNQTTPSFLFFHDDFVANHVQTWHTHKHQDTAKLLLFLQYKHKVQVYVLVYTPTHKQKASHVYKIRLHTSRADLRQSAKPINGASDLWSKFLCFYWF